MRPSPNIDPASVYECQQCGSRTRQPGTRACEACGGSLRNLGRPRDL